MRSKMSSKERILAAVKHQEGDYVPVAPRIWAWLLEYYGERTWKTDLRAAKEFDFDPICTIVPGLPDYIAAPEITDGCAKLKNVKVENNIRHEGEFKIIRRKFTTPAGELTDEIRVPPAGDFDLKLAKEKWGKRLCFKGYIETVHVMRLGTPAKIRNAVAEAMRLGAPGGGFILGTSDSIRDGTPLENVKAYFSAARKFGKFK